MKYSELSTELSQRSVSAGLVFSLAAFLAIFAVLSCSSAPAVPAEAAGRDTIFYTADFYRLPPVSVQAGSSGQDEVIEAILLPEPDFTGFFMESAATEANPDDPVRGADVSPDVTVLSRLLIISQLELPEPALPDRVETDMDPAVAAEIKRTETASTAGPAEAEITTGSSASAAGSAVTAAAETATAGTPSETVSSVSAATAEPAKPAPVLPAVSPVVEAEPSRLSVSAFSNQPFYLRFSGAGWTFVGDEDGQAGIQLRTRQFENNEVIFSLAPVQAGDYLLLFRRQNPLNQQMETSLVAVAVSNQAPSLEPDSAAPADPALTAAAAAAARAAAPDSAAPAAAGASAATPRPVLPAASTVSSETRTGETASAVPSEAATTRGSTANSDLAAVSSMPLAPPAAAMESVPEADTKAQLELDASDSVLAALPADLLSFARAELEAMRVATGLEALDRLAAKSGPSTAGQDELLYLYGLAYELDTSFRDIKLSHQYYMRVRDDYPRSRFRRMVLERIAWMERHFPGLR